MKIKTVHIENFKNIKLLDENLDGKNIILLADNGLGKSSFMQAIRMAMGSKEMPPRPIADGQDESFVEVITDEDGKEHTFKMRIVPGKKPMLEVTAPSGIRDNRKSTIGLVVGEIDFDIEEFVHMSESIAGKKKQVEIIKSFLPEETRQELRAFEQKSINAYEYRTEVNRKIKSLQGFIKERDLAP